MGAGELQDDWYDGINVLKNADLSGKTVAIFGCGDSESYSDTFCSAMKEIYVQLKVLTFFQVFQLMVIPLMYEAVVDGKFVGLALDDVNEDDRLKVVLMLG